MHPPSARCRTCGVRVVSQADDPGLCPPRHSAGSGFLLGKKGTRVAVGQSVSMLDAEERVTGRVNYVLNFELPGMLYGKILRSPLPHAPPDSYRCHARQA